MYLTPMTWLISIGLFDICDRTRLGERFFGATHTVLARL
ncbi:MAG TPA: isopropylmalate isomerase [Sulfitobacter sp.]|nr:isopropylmalate isomerase [Sulfitobacter sp.]